MNILREKISALADWLRRKTPQMTLPNVLANVLLAVVVAMAPHQVPVLVYKLAGVLLAACVLYMLDASLFPYAHPSSYLAKPWRDQLTFKEDKPDHAVAVGCELLFIAACARRCLLICAGMLAVALAL